MYNDVLNLYPLHERLNRSHQQIDNAHFLKPRKEPALPAITLLTRVVVGYHIRSQRSHLTSRHE